MKPERLVLQAFGPYTGREEIDFLGFGQHPMILINGPTGSGKSTLLDAICFALYGGTSGNDRDASQMRAQLADAADLSEVTFVFSLGSDRWRIRRVPQQRRPKRRGEGFTEHSPEAQLWRLLKDGTEQLVEIRGTSEITRYVETLTGLNADQFRQVMVLPQGKFRELLVAPSSEREKIFSTLFDSAIYKRIEDSLRARAGDIRKKVEAVDLKSSGVLEQAGVDNRDALLDAVGTLEPTTAQLASEKDLARKEMNQARDALKSAEAIQLAFTRVAQLKARLAALEERSRQLAADQTRLEKAIDAQQLLPLAQLHQKNLSALDIQNKALRELQNRMAENAKAVRSLVEPLEQARKAFADLAPQRAKLQDLQSLVDKHVSLVPRQTSIVELESAVQKAELTHDTAVTERERLKKEMGSIETELARCRHRSTDLSGTPLLLRELEQAGQARALLDAGVQELAEISVKFQQQTSALQKLRVDLQKDQRQLKETEFHWHLGQAALLAGELQPGTSCPVCGSEEHPSPARQSPGTKPVDRAQVETAREAVATQVQQLHSLDSHCQRLADAQQRRESTNNTLAAELGSYRTLDSVELSARIDREKNQMLELETVTGQLPEIEAKLTNIRQQSARHEEACSASMSSVADARGRLKAESDQYQLLLAAIPPEYRDRRVVESHLKDLEVAIEHIENSYDSTSKRMRSLELVSADLTARHDELDQRKKSVEDECHQSELNWQKGLETSRFVDEADFRRSELDESDIKNLVRLLEDHEREITETRGSLSESMLAVEGKQPQDIERLQGRIVRVEALLKEIDEKWQLSLQKLQLAQSALRTLDRNEVEARGWRQEYAVVGRLSNAASGQSASRVSLQRFVLSVLLDDVLLDASRRMRNMSRNRFELIRREDRSGRNRASGLELDVFDAWSGQSRPVATLSGGESFQAALSLALGLSEVVQAYAGGIRLDTLFIDEGFGSLDSDALDLAIKTLTDLQSSGRTIGVISHVTELKEQLQQRLDIVPSPTGSRIHARSLRGREFT